MTERILEGLRIVDLTSGLAGSVATQMLAEAGADVIKVEPPGGDPMRAHAPAAFACWNRSKRSLVLDLRDAADRDRLDALLASADVLAHGLRPSKAKSLGLDDDTLARRFPRLVVSAITGYPPGHADAERPGWDLLSQAREGLMHMQSGWQDGRPFAWRFPAPSWGAAYLAASGIVARLYHREEAGVGGPAHTSLAQGLHLIQNMVWNRAEKPSRGLLAGQPGTLTMKQVAMWECADGRWIQVLAPPGTADITQIPLMAETIRALDVGGLKLFQPGVMERVLKQHTSEEWLAAIRAADVAAEPIARLGELLEHPEAIDNEYVVEVEDPVFGPTRQPASPFRTDPPSRVRSAAPTLGEHAAEILAELAAAAPARVVARATRPAPRRPLEGVRVVDFGGTVAGPLGPMLLSDLGAEVVKVEPLKGDTVRSWREGFYVAANRGKRGVALDLRHPEADEIRRRLIAWADVVHHNVRPKAAARLGIDEAATRAANPDAVFGHTSAYGLRGKRADWPGYDSVFQSLSGWSWAMAGEGNPPLFNHLGTFDTLTAASAAIGMLLALFHRKRTGEATSTWSALLNTCTHACSETLLRLADGGLEPAPALDAGQTGLGPGYRIYALADGWIAVVAVGEQQMSAFRKVAGVASDGALEAALRARKLDEVLSALGAAGVAAERVRERFWFEVWDDEEHRRTGLVTSYPQVDWGRMEQFGAFWDFGDLALRLDRACPGLGEHTTDVLTELGFDPAEIARLAAAGVVATGPRG